MYIYVYICIYLCIYVIYVYVSFFKIKNSFKNTSGLLELQQHWYYFNVFKVIDVIAYVAQSSVYLTSLVSKVEKAKTASFTFLKKLPIWKNVVDQPCFHLWTY